MGQTLKDTAILIFSLSAQLEAERKSLFGKRNKKSSKGFFDILINRTHEIATSTKADVFVIDESLQKGTSFGERYANAFQELFDQGYTKVLSIGNDTPDLTASVLEQAVDRIQNNDLVIGPSTDGGVYLLGMHREFFNLNEFKA
ncbi:TIGR04282 family arsenosugar biosynthesis glycosyltransferase, partial [Zobellia laminariae]